MRTFREIALDIGIGAAYMPVFIRDMAERQLELDRIYATIKGFANATDEQMTCLKAAVSDCDIEPVRVLRALAFGTTLDVILAASDKSCADFQRALFIPPF